MIMMGLTRFCIKQKLLNGTQSGTLVRMSVILVILFKSYKFFYCKIFYFCNKTKSVLNCVPRMTSYPTCLTCLMCLRGFVSLLLTCLQISTYLTGLYFFTCVTCLHFLRALRTFIFLRALPTFFFYVHSVLSFFYVPNVSSLFTCLTCPHFLACLAYLYF